MTKAEYMDMYDMVGIAMEVYNTLGRGLAEQIYQEAFMIEARQRNIEIEQEKKLTITYKGIVLSKHYFAD
nr:GxxExxY protein [Bacteroidales bacterium]